MLTTCLAPILLKLLHLATAVTDDTSTGCTTVAPVVPVRATRMKNELCLIEQLELVKPISVNLSCVLENFLGGKPDRIQGSWEKDGVEIQSEVTIPQVDGKYSLRKEFFVEHLGNFSCIFYNATEKVVKTFVVTAPTMKEERKKPVVGYMGDSAVLTCKIHPAPESWLWYKVNGTEKVAINTTDKSPRYKVTLKGEEVILMVMNVTEEDAGSYLCMALYPISPAEGVVHLKIITFMEPLKPFLVILTEVLVLVSLIAACELHGKKKASQATQAASGGTGTSENESNASEAEKPRLKESNGMEETATRQRKV